MRPSRDNVYMEMAYSIAKRATCARRQVGCILVNKQGHVLATGYNGVARGLPHCNESHPIHGYANACKGRDHSSGEGLDVCQATHAEQNALLQCKDVEEIDVCYSTAQPCIHCTKLLLNTGCKTIVFSEGYPHELAEKLWLEADRGLHKI